MLLGTKKNDRFLFRSKDDSRKKMTEYIRNRFADVLGDDVRLLDLPNGLEIVQEKVRARLAEVGLAAERAKAA